MRSTWTSALASGMKPWGMIFSWPTLSAKADGVDEDVHEKDGDNDERRGNIVVAAVVDIANVNDASAYSANSIRFARHRLPFPVSVRESDKSVITPFLEPPPSAPPYSHIKMQAPGVNKRSCWMVQTSDGNNGRIKRDDISSR